MARLLAQKLNAVVVPKGIKNGDDACEYGFLGSLKTKPHETYAHAVMVARAVSRPIVSPCNAPLL